MPRSALPRSVPDPGFGSVAAPNEADARDASVIDRLRVVSSGLLASCLVHEFANLLTIVDGGLQMARLGLAPPDPATIDPTAVRCGALVRAFRHLFGRPRPVGAVVALRSELAMMEPLLSARLRGQRTRVLVAAEGGSVTVGDGVVAEVRAGWFALVLAELEARRPDEGELLAIEMAVEPAVGGGALRARFVRAVAPGTTDQDAAARPVVSGVAEELRSLGEAALLAAGWPSSRLRADGAVVLHASAR